MDEYVTWENIEKFIKLYSLKDKIKREDELMSHLWNDGFTRQTVEQMLHHQNKKESKSVIKAQVLKNIGNKQFLAEDYLDSIQSYTECAMYAPENSPERSVAIANRSASLFYSNRYTIRTCIYKLSIPLTNIFHVQRIPVNNDKDCINDIELAIELGCPKKLHFKLHWRKVQCYLQMGNPDLAKEMISKIRESIDDPNYNAPSMKDDIEKQISGLTFNGPCTSDESEHIDDRVDLRSILMFDENPNFPHASSSVDRKFNEEQGRHVVANRFIRKGEVLFLEKPISFVFENDDGIRRFCQHCCRKTDIPVPCSKCLNTFYCDTNCLNEAWSSYHCWECAGNQMGLWNENLLGKLALKILLVCTTTTDTIKFNEMQNLITNFDKEPIEKLIEHAIMAIMVTSYLLEHTDFFQRHNLNDSLARKFVDNSFNSNFLPITNDNKHLYISSLLLRYILQITFNGTSILRDSMHMYLDCVDLNFEVNTDVLAKAIYPSASMMNHSCDSNIITNFMDQYQIVRASKDIVANEEIFTCYGPNYRNATREVRQEELSSSYCFTCKCKHCTEPNLEYFLERFSAMNCSKCNGALCKINNSLFCLDCFDKPKHFRQNKIKQAEKLFNQAISYVVQENVAIALKKLKKCLSIRRRMLYKSHGDIVSTLYILSKLYIEEGKFANAKKCWESIIEAVIERWGPTSLMLVNELYALVSICIAHLETTSNTTTSSFKDLLTTTYEYLEQIDALTDLNYGSWSITYALLQGKKKSVDDIPSVKASLNITK